MSNGTQEIGGLVLQIGKPTRLTFGQLRTWVIWQFPRRKAERLCGAVHPPGDTHGWYPALIDGKKERAEVYGHLDQVFDSPEAAADWLATV